MAFGFIKKVFSFGRKEVVEEKVDETSLPPLNLDALKPAEAAPPPAAPGPEHSPPPATENQPAPTSEPDTPPEVPEPEPQAPAVPEPVVPPNGPVEVPSKPAPREPIPELPEPVPAPPEVPQDPQPEPGGPDIPPPVPETPAPPPEAPPAAPEEMPAPAPAGEPAEPPPVEVPPPAPGASVPSETVRGETPQPATLDEPVEPAALAEPAATGEAFRPVRDERPAQGTSESAAAHPARSEGAKVTVAKRVEQKAELIAAPVQEPRKSWFQRMREGLARSSRELTGNIAGVFTKRKLDEDTLQDLEDVLIRADLGVETALRITDSLASSRYGKNVSDEEVRAIMAEEIGKVLTPVAQPLELDLSHKPHVILVVGVNGTGKTTTIGKLAAKLTAGGLSVMLAAGDTFRAAAIEQLKIWGERTASPVIATKLGADAAGLAYEAFEKAKAAGSDVLIIDTAGRLQNKAELMAELEKIVRVLGKLDPEAPHTVLQTVDATTGQNALNQVEIFRNVAGVNGLVMTKLDGTARGGILVAIAAKHKLPVYFIGVGEQVDDLEPFSANDFARAIAGVA